MQRPFRTQTSFRQRYRYTRYETNKNIFQRWAASPSFYYQVGGLAVVGGGFYTYNLETVPVSGRRRFNFIGPEMEESISKGQYGQILQEYRGRILPAQSPQARKVREVLDRYGPTKSRLHGMVKTNWNEWQINPSKWPPEFELGGECDTERRTECLCHPWVRVQHTLAGVDMYEFAD